MALWADAKKAVEEFFDCRATVEVFLQQETSWGESVQEEAILIPDMACRVVMKGSTVKEDGVVFKNHQRGKLLFPVAETIPHIPQGSRVTVVFPDGQSKRFFTEGEDVLYKTHREAWLRDIKRN